MKLSSTLLFVLVLSWLVKKSKLLDSSKKHSSNQLNILKNDKIEADATVENTIQALERIAFYYMKQKDQATVDFAFGMRVAEGEIARVLHLIDAGVFLDIKNSRAIKKRLKTLLEFIKTILKESLPFIEKMNKSYFDQFHYLIQEKWSSIQLKPQISEPIDESAFPSNIFENKIFTEEKSDLCMSTLMGNDKYKTCSIDICWDLMTNMDSSLYYATHQVLWLLLGERWGCEKLMDKKAKESGYTNGIEDILKRKCSSIIIEMEAITEDGVRKGLIDIFLEQGFICGGLGFMDAVRPQWLKLGLSWQDPNLGCIPEYQLDGDEQEEKEEFEFWINYKRQKWKSRNLLVESVLNDGCTTHTTAVAAGFFAIYLRLFFDPTYRKNQLDPYIKQSSPLAEEETAGIIWEMKYLLVALLISVILLFLCKKRNVSAILILFLRRLYALCRKKITTPTLTV